MKGGGWLFAVLLGACLPSASDPVEVPRRWGPPPPALRVEQELPGGVGARAVSGVTPLWPYARGTLPRAMRVQGTRVRLTDAPWEGTADGDWRLALPLVDALVLTGLRVDDMACGANGVRCSVVGNELQIGGVGTAPRRLAFNAPPEIARIESVIRGRNLVKSALSTAVVRIDDEPAPVVVLGERAVQVTFTQLGSGATLGFRPRFLRSALFTGTPAPLLLEVVGTRSGGAPQVVWKGSFDPMAAPASAVSIPLDPSIFQAWSMLVVKAVPGPDAKPGQALLGVTVLADLAVRVPSP
jgi:hypothetical protein